MACVGLEAAGRVKISVDPKDPPDQRLCDTPMTDSFIQFGGFLVNYFNNPSLKNVFVCHKIDQVETGGAFNPDANEWIIYSNMREDGDGQATSDVYIFEAESKRMVMATFGMHFSKMPRSSLAKMLKDVKKPGPEQAFKHANVKVTIDSAPIVNDQQPHEPGKRSVSRREDLFRSLSSVTDVPLENLKDDTSLEDLGIDSLMATEVVNDIRANFDITIDLATLLFFPNLAAMVTHLDAALGINAEADDSKILQPASQNEPYFTSQLNGTSLETKDPLVDPASVEVGKSSRPSLGSAYDAFRETRLGYDERAVQAQATNFWSDVYPDQAKLVLAYVVEAFADLGCNLKKLQVGGDRVLMINFMSRHKKFVDQLYRIMEDGDLISAAGSRGFVRSSVRVPTTPAEVLYNTIVVRWPVHANAHRLVKVVGSELAACLTGKKNCIHMLFGNQDNKHTLEDMYENWPLFRTPTLLLGDFLLKVLKTKDNGKFRLLEVGGGTGGTTRHIVSLLQAHGVPFEYTFTDISASLVAAAKKQFQGAQNMSFEVLDIEKPPKPKYNGEFHVIISTNCIHATRRLRESLSNIHNMLREDGVLALVETTRNMFWLDIIVGLLERLWLFEDDRSHALVDEHHWARVMKDTGFAEVMWTDGKEPESQTTRVIGAFKRLQITKPLDAPRESGIVTSPRVESVVYKKLDDLEIHADIYYPAKFVHGTKLPVGKFLLRQHVRC